MKRLLLLLIFSSPFLLNAQLKYGVNAGVNVSNMDMKYQGISYEGEKKSKIGFYAGLYANYMFAKKFAIQPEIMYSQQGAILEYEEYTHEIKDKYKLDYLLIPVMFKFYFIENVNMEIGPQIGFLLKGKVKSSDTAYDYNLGEDMQAIDFSINIGLGYELKNGLNFGTRYSLGLTNVYDDNRGYEFEDDWKNRVLSFGLGYTF